MQTPLIMSAFGTTSKAVATYARIDAALREHFPATEIIWAYSSRMITRELHERQKSTVKHPAEVLCQLADQGVPAAIMQSLHLFPGAEFHGLLRIAAASPLKCAVGKPLLTSMEDYQQVGEILRPVIEKRPQKAILVLGHGTDHPIWTAYYSLEKILRQKFGERIFVGVVEKSPDSAHLVDEIADRGFTEVCILPLFLVAGMHYRRDIISDSPSSWQSRLQGRKIAVESLDFGLGLYPGLEELIARHIMEAGRLSENQSTTDDKNTCRY